MTGFVLLKVLWTSPGFLCRNIIEARHLLDISYGELTDIQAPQNEPAMHEFFSRHLISR